LKRVIQKPSKKVNTYGVKVSSYSTKFKVDIDPKKQFVYHIPEKLNGKFVNPRNYVEMTKEEALKVFAYMDKIRKLETAASGEYTQRKIRGFLHLYAGQEAVGTGVETELTYEDHCITAYRDHGHQILRGDSCRSVMAELFGRVTGCSKGKGGSMHMYLAKNNFWGGNGIVGAQIPIGTGLAYALKYKKKPNVCSIYYGDGAANQGQVFEAFNMASLWNLPCLFICEDNKYGMGTSTKRSSASEDYYARGDYIPGMKVDGMDVFAVREATRVAKEWAIKNGPVVLHFSTYRYFGHSMSDPGLTYRSRDEVQEVRTNKDPIHLVKHKIIEAKIATEEELTEIEAKTKEEVADAVKFAAESAWPTPDELYSDVYIDPPYDIRGTLASKVYHATK